MFENGDALQIFYRWNRGTMLDGRLAYFPRPYFLNAQFDEGASALIDEHDILFPPETPDTDSFGLVPRAWGYIRVDYDHDALGHEPCHLQFATWNELRVPSAVMPGPLAFLHLVFCSVRPDWARRAVETTGWSGEIRRARACSRADLAMSITQLALRGG